jgi:hypothetical protein
MNEHAPGESPLYEPHSGGRYGARGGRHASAERAREAHRERDDGAGSPWHENAVRALEEARATID